MKKSKKQGYSNALQTNFHQQFCFTKKTTGKGDYAYTGRKGSCPPDGTQDGTATFPGTSFGAKKREGVCHGEHRAKRKKKAEQSGISPCEQLTWWSGKNGKKTRTAKQRQTISGGKGRLKAEEDWSPVADHGSVAQGLIVGVNATGDRGARELGRRRLTTEKKEKGDGKRKGPAQRTPLSLSATGYLTRGAK